MYLNRCPKCQGEWVDAGDVLVIADYSRKQEEEGLKRCTLPLAQYSAWQYLGGLVASLTGRVVPLVDENPRSRSPQIVQALIALNVAIYLWQTVLLRNPQGVILAFGAIPVTHGQWSTLCRIFTAMFVHAGFLHLLGNMFFRWRFGANVDILEPEDQIQQENRYPVSFALEGAGGASDKVPGLSVGSGLLPQGRPSL